MMDGVDGMSSIIVVEPVVTKSNACYKDYVKFSKLPKFELDSIQRSYYNELHALQDELAKLLDEFRELLPYSSASFVKRSA